MVVLEASTMWHLASLSRFSKRSIETSHAALGMRIRRDDVILAHSHVNSRSDDDRQEGNEAKRATVGTDNGLSPSPTDYCLGCFTYRCEGHVQATTEADRR